MPALVDTGAQITRISEETARLLGSGTTKDIGSMECDLPTYELADSTPGTMKGCIELTFLVQKSSPIIAIKYKFYVADIKSQAILGFDFIDEHGDCSVKYN